MRWLQFTIEQINTPFNPFLTYLLVFLVLEMLQKAPLFKLFKCQRVIQTAHRCNMWRNVSQPLWFQRARKCCATGTSWGQQRIKVILHSYTAFYWVIGISCVILRNDVGGEWRKKQRNNGRPLWQKIARGPMCHLWEERRPRSVCLSVFLCIFELLSLSEPFRVNPPILKTDIEVNYLHAHVDRRRLRMSYAAVLIVSYYRTTHRAIRIALKDGGGYV